MQVYAGNGAHALVEEMEFDVAVTTGSAAETQGGGGIKVWSIAEMGARMQGATSDEQVTRIRFKVPLIYPPHLDKKLQSDRDADQRAQTAKVYAGFERPPA